MSREKICLWEDVSLIEVSTGVEKNKNENENEKLPAVIICPGGGFYCMASDEGLIYGEIFEQLGFKAFVLEYSMDEKARFPQPLLDIGNAFKYVKDNCEELSVNIDQIYVYGISAGGFVAASLGMLWNSDIISGFFKKEKGFFKPKGIILSYPLLNMKNHIASWGENDDLADCYKNINLLNLVNDNMPSTFIVHNQDDTLVPVTSSKSFSEKLTELNIKNELHIFEKGGHSFLNDYSLKKWFLMFQKWLKTIN